MLKKIPTRSSREMRAEKIDYWSAWIEFRQSYQRFIGVS